jgi:hypothetical protein
MSGYKWGNGLACQGDDWTSMSPPWIKKTVSVISSLGQDFCIVSTVVRLIVLVAEAVCIHSPENRSSNAGSLDFYAIRR